MNLWFMAGVVVTGDKIVATYPDAWDTLRNPEELIYVNDTTLKVGETDSFLSGGELVRFNIKNGKVESVNYNGSTMWPEKIWLKMLKDRKKFETGWLQAS